MRAQFSNGGFGERGLQCALENVKVGRVGLGGYALALAVLSPKDTGRGLDHGVQNAAISRGSGPANALLPGSLLVSCARTCGGQKRWRAAGPKLSWAADPLRPLVHFDEVGSSDRDVLHGHFPLVNAATNSGPRSCWSIQCWGLWRPWSSVVERPGG